VGAAAPRQLHRSAAARARPPRRSSRGAHVKRTNSVRARHQSIKPSLHDVDMRYLAVVIGVLGTLVLIAPIH
jgi:hypothetical protein